MTVGDELVFTGGTLASVFDEMEALFDTMKLLEPPFDEWETFVAVYNSSDCSNPSGNLEISGFASVIITDVVGGSTKTIDGVVKCDLVKSGGPGGGAFGTLSSIPVLVQ